VLPHLPGVRGAQLYNYLYNSAGRRWVAFERWPDRARPDRTGPDRGTGPGRSAL